MQPTKIKSAESVRHLIIDIVDPVMLSLPVKPHAMSLHTHAVHMRYESMNRVIALIIWASPRDGCGVERAF